MDKTSNLKIKQCHICNGSGFISTKSKWYKESSFSYENRFHKYLLWVECPRCIGYGINSLDSGTKRWDEYHLLC